MGFSRQEYQSELPFPSRGDLPDPGIKPGYPALQADSLPSKPPRKPGGKKKISQDSFGCNWKTSAQSIFRDEKGNLLVHKTEELRSKPSSRHVEVGGLQLSLQFLDVSLHHSALLSSEIAQVSGRCPRGGPWSSSRRFSHWLRAQNPLWLGMGYLPWGKAMWWSHHSGLGHKNSPQPSTVRVGEGKDKINYKIEPNQFV